jgi:hypothetical protein
MSVVGAFSRSRPAFAPAGKEVTMAMSKWWKKMRPAEGEVSALDAPFYSILEGSC